MQAHAKAFKRVEVRSSKCKYVHLQIVKMHSNAFKYNHMYRHTYSFKCIQKCIHIRVQSYRSTIIQKYIHLGVYSYRSTFIQDYIHIRVYPYKSIFIQKYIIFRYMQMHKSVVQPVNYIQAYQLLILINASSEPVRTVLSFPKYLKITIH